MAIMGIGIMRGNSQQQAPAVDDEASQQAAPPRELPPAAAEMLAKYNAVYSAVWKENDTLCAENAKLRADNEILRRLDAEKSAIIADLRKSIVIAEAHFRERLAESDRSKETYLQFSMRIRERIKSCADDLTTAYEIAMEIPEKIDSKPAGEQPTVPPKQLNEIEQPTVPPKQLNEIEQMIADAVKDAHAGHPATTTEGRS